MPHNKKSHGRRHIEDRTWIHALKLIIFHLNPTHRKLPPLFQIRRMLKKPKSLPAAEGPPPDEDVADFWKNTLTFFETHPEEQKRLPKLFTAKPESRWKRGLKYLAMTLTGYGICFVLDRLVPALLGA